MNWEMYAYNSGDFFRMIFNGIAMIFGADDYLSAIMTVVMLGFIGTLIRAAFDRDLFNSFRWFIAMITFYALVMLPKTTIIITDRIDPGKSAVVQNVPIGVAATASFFSSVGDYLTRTFETVFAMPNQITYTESGLLFAHKLLDATRKMTIQDGRVKENFDQFFSSCVVIDGIGHYRFTWSDVTRSNNLINFFSANVAENVAFYRHQNQDGTQSILNCRSGFTNRLAPELTGQSLQITEAGTTSLISETGSSALAVDKYNDTLQDNLGYLIGVADDPATVVVQNAIINAMGSAAIRFSQEIGADEFNQYIIAGAELHRLTTYQALGNIASEKLPLLKIIFEGFLYAIFPVIALIAMISPKGVSMAYVQALVWINLWPVIYAVLHFIMSYYSQRPMMEMATIWGNGMTAASNIKLAEYSADIVATTGYLTTAIPLLCWMLVSKSGAIAASFAGRVMQGYDSSVEQQANQVAQGEGQRLGQTWQMTETGRISQSSLMDSGTTQTTSGDNTRFLQQDNSRFLVNPQSLSSSVQQSSQNLSSAVQSEARSAAQLADASSAVSSQSQQLMNQLQASNASNESFATARSEMEQETRTLTAQKLDEWAKSQGVKLDSQANAAVQAKMGIGISAAVGVSAGVTSDEAFKQAERFMQSEQFSDVTTQMAQTTYQLGNTYGTSETDTANRQLNAALNNQQTAIKSYDAAVSNRIAAENSLAAATELKQVLSVDGQQALMNAAQAAGWRPDQLDQVVITAAASPGSAESAQALNELRGLLRGSQFQEQELDPQFSEKMSKINNTGDEAVQRLQGQGQEDVMRTGSAQTSELNSSANYRGRGEIEDTHESTVGVSRSQFSIGPQPNNDSEVINTLRQEFNIESEQVQNEVSGRVEEGLIGNTLIGVGKVVDEGVEMVKDLR